MTYDQAQSPRLGQRTPVESTYVQIFDVDPATETADLVEAAWPGMLIFRGDRGILQIYNGEAGAWQDVAGGVAGQLTFVGPTEPTGTAFSIGDTWYDSDDGYQQYVWNGTAWVAVAAGAAGIQTYYENGFQLSDPGDPSSAMVFTPIAGGAIGDIWYQTDDNMRQWRWNGTIWQDAHDPNINAAQASINENALAIQVNTTQIEVLDANIQELGFVATSVNNSADTADGRVSMSDYQPGEDDLLYDTVQMQIDPDTGLASEVQTQVPRVNGSIWFTRTRPRQNLCMNPSLEMNDALWIGWGITTAIHTHHPVPAGIATLHCYVSASVATHEIRYGQDAPIPCEEAEIYTASVYAELLTGTAPDMTLQLRWLDSGGAVIGTDIGDPYTLVLNAFDPLLMGTIAEPRVYVTGTAPAGAVAFYVAEVIPNSAVSIEYHTGAMLIEQEDDLGRYFDGDSYDCIWAAEPHGSYSEMYGDKIVEIWELRDGAWIKKYLTSQTIYSLEASKLTGVLSGGMIGDSSIAPSKMLTIPMMASEALAAGDIVNIWNDAGVYKIRKASASARYEAHGFVVSAVTSGAFAYVFHTGYVGNHAGLPPGNIWLSTTAGRATGQPPSAVGQLVQRVGFAPNSGILNFSLMQAIRIT